MAAAVAGIFYGWGTGLFDPCGPVDRIIRVSTCRVATVLEGRSVEALLPLGSGSLLMGVRAANSEAATPPALVEFDLARGTWGTEVALPDLPADGLWVDAAMTPDGSRLIVAILDEPTRILDRATGHLVAELPIFGLGPWRFAGPDEVRLGIDRANFDKVPQPAARAFDARDAAELSDVEGRAALPLFREGLSRALSPDGARLAQHVRTRADAGVVAVRLTAAADPETDGSLLVASLGAYLADGQLFPRLSFSPSGAYLAASFDSAPVWGRATSALLVWDVETSELLVRVPTRAARWENLVWHEDTREIVASRFDPDRARSEVAVISY